MRYGLLTRGSLGILGGLGVANVAMWICLLAASRHAAFLLPLGALAYVFGLRHAADADHIAAIDNTTRKLLADGKRPGGVGLFFALGHSTIVFVLAALLLVATRSVKSALPALASVGGLLGMGVSAGFLYLLALLNLMVLLEVLRAFRQARRQPDLDPERWQAIERGLLQRGFMNRFFGRVYRSIHSDRQMYWVGLLFGLGFDTASEVGLLALAAVAAGRSVSALQVLMLPLMFAAGMTLVDALEAVVMQYAYAWAFITPLRKLYYNLAVTAISVAVALGIGTLEWLRVLAVDIPLRGRVWDLIKSFDLGNFGYVIISILLLGWLGSVAVFKLLRLDAPLRDVTKTAQGD